MEIFPKKLGNAPVAELLYVVLDFFASIKKGSSGDVTPRRNLSYIIEMIKIYLLEILELDAVCL